MDKYSTARFLQEAGGDKPIRIIVKSQDTKSERLFEFRQPFILIGRHERADLRLDSLEISRRQTYLQLVNGRLFGIHLSTRVPTLWDGTSQRSGWIDAQSTLQVGPFSLRFPEAEQTLESTELASPSPLAPAPHPRARITLEFEPRSPATSPLVLDRTLTLMGSMPGCTALIKHPRVTGILCALVRTDRGLWCVDLNLADRAGGSEALPRARFLAHGNALKIGGRRLVVRYEKGAEELGAGVRALAADEDGAFATAGRPQSLGSLEQAASSDTAEVCAMGALAGNSSLFQPQIGEQFHEIMAMMIQTFGTMLSEHREFIREESTRLEQLVRSLVEHRGELPAVTGKRPSMRPPSERANQSVTVPDLSASLPPMSDPFSEDRVHVWLQERFEDLGRERAPLWDKMAGLFRAKSSSIPRS